MLVGFGSEKRTYHTFAEYPGFKEYYDKSCRQGKPFPTISEKERKLLQKYRPRFIVPPGGRYFIDFYEDYLPFTALRRYPEKTILENKVDPETLKKVQGDLGVYLDFRLASFREAGLDRRFKDLKQQDSIKKRKPVVYGRFFQERVDFAGENEKLYSKSLIFLKYNLVFVMSGLPARLLPVGLETILKLTGLDPDNWHELDNFVAVHIVLNEEEKPVAVILAQHNNHRTYLVGKDIFLPSDRRMVFDIALRSNEVYPASNSKGPVEHRVIRWNLYMKYLLSGEGGPFFRGYDITYGIKAGGREGPYNLAFLSPCDPFYRAKILLGEPRPFMGKYIGRDGPPGSDYYAIPSLLPLGNLLKFSYLHDYDPEDIKMVEESIDAKKKKIDVKRLMDYGGKKFYKDLNSFGLAPTQNE